MKTPQCMPSFTIFSAFLFQIYLSQATVVSQQGNARLFYQKDAENSPLQSLEKQDFSSALRNEDIIQPRQGNRADSLTYRAAGPRRIEDSGEVDSTGSKTGNINNSRLNLTRIVSNSIENSTWNIVTPQAPFFSKFNEEVTPIPRGRDNSLIGLPAEGITSSSPDPTWNALVPQVPNSISRLKREEAEDFPRKITTLFGLQKSDEIFNADQSLEALLRKIIVDHMNGCDLIIVYDEIYNETKTLDTLVSFPVIKQVLQLVSLEDLSDMILWESQNCQGTVLLLSDPDILINFGRINRFLWAYQAKVIIVGLQLPSLEKFLKTVKGRKTEHVIGVVEDPINHHLQVYMNLLFWGEGMQRLTGWSGNGFTKRADLFPDKITDLRGGEVRVLIFEWRPILFYEYAPDRSVIARHGRFLTIVRTLGEIFNFTLKLVEIEAEWGLPLGNGSFDGLVGYLQRDDGHMGLPYIYHSGLDGRNKAQDNSRPIEDDKGCFLVRTEAPRPAWQNPGLPFTPQSWIAVISGIILSGPIFYLFVIASTATGEEYENFKSLAYSSLFTIGIQIDHPLVSMPKRMCNQIFIVFLLVYSLILSTGYRSNLISFLTVARPPYQINTFKDLAESGLQVYGIVWFKNAVDHSGDPHLKEVLKRYKIKFTIEEFMDEFMEGKVSTLNSKALLEVISTLVRTKTGKPLTRFLKECLSSYTATIGFQWHTPLKPRFNKAIARLVESGITRQWVLELNQQYKKLVEREGGVTYYPDIWHNAKDGLIPLGNSHMTGIWAIVALGYFLGTISFAVEVIGHKG